jgi:hypothetical protein
MTSGGNILIERGRVIIATLILPVRSMLADVHVGWRASSAAFKREDGRTRSFDETDFVQ